MLIRGDVYDSMVRLCRRRIRDQASITASDAQTLGGGTSFDVLLTVLRQQYRRHIRRTAHRHRSAGALASYKQRWEKRGECIMDIAASVNFSSYQLARLVVEAVCGVGKAVVSRWVKDTSLIPNARLQREVAACIEMDMYCSPFVDRVRQTVGAEYEYILHQTLRNRGIPFQSEDELRSKGWAKTPDVKLKLPIGVVDGAGKARVVNWIDSKAMFGDPDTHFAQNGDQLRGYVNRFGPGLVLYWFGCVESVAGAGRGGGRGRPGRGSEEGAQRQQLLSTVTAAHRFPARFVMPGDAAVRSGVGRAAARFALPPGKLVHVL